MSSRRLRGEAGTVTAFVACFTVALIVVAGLVVDGGLVLASRRHAFDDADAAARAGAQAIDQAALRDGRPVAVDPRRAQELAQQQLAVAGETGRVEVDGETVTVHITRVQQLSILGLAGVGPITIHATGTARAVRGVTTGGD